VDADLGDVVIEEDEEMIQERTRHTAPGLLMLLIFIIILVVAGLGIFRASGCGISRARS
jgi:predicted nucleic acid-binding Zn ribbon protein